MKGIKSKWAINKTKVHSPSGRLMSGTVCDPNRSREGVDVLARLLSVHRHPPLK